MLFETFIQIRTYKKTPTLSIISGGFSKQRNHQTETVLPVPLLVPATISLLVQSIVIVEFYCLGFCLPSLCSLRAAPAYSVYMSCHHNAASPSEKPSHHIIVLKPRLLNEWISVYSVGKAETKPGNFKKESNKLFE